MDIGSWLICPNGSVLRPVNGHMGTPSLSESNPPTPHPLAIHPAGPEKDAGVGTCHNQFTVRFRLMLKSDSPLTMLKSHHGVAAVGLEA